MTQPTHNKKRYSCVLLSTDNAHLADSAETFAKTLFDVLHVSRYPRCSRQLVPEAQHAFQNMPVDFLFSFLCPVLIKESMLRATRIASINFHPAPPKYPGVCCASYAIYNGDSKYGATAHIMDSQPDSGIILQTREFPILENDTCETIYDRAIHDSLKLFYDLLDPLASTGQAEPNGQKWTCKAYTRKQFERWMTLSPDDPPEKIKRIIRAVRHSRFPGPFMEIDGKKVELTESSLCQT